MSGDLAPVTVEYVYAESSPYVTGIGEPDHLNNEAAELPEPYREALLVLLEQIDSLRCARCDAPVGFRLAESSAGFEQPEWTPTGLAREGDGPVALLCEVCTPYVPPPAD